MLETEVVEIELPNGAVALVRARNADAQVRGLGAGLEDRFDLGEVAGVLDGVSMALKSALAKAAPDSLSDELGVEFVVKAGRLTALIVDGEAAGSPDRDAGLGVRRAVRSSLNGLAHGWGRDHAP